MFVQRFGDFTEVDELQKVILKEKQIDGSKDPEFVARFSTTFHPLCEINKVTKEAVNLKKLILFPEFFVYETKQQSVQSELLSINYKTEELFR